MRASRLVSLLGLLQARGRMTASQLAAELEVSPRTVLRDIEALGAAGIPVYALRGCQGGFALVDGFRAGFRQAAPRTGQRAPGSSAPGRAPGSSAPGCGSRPAAAGWRYCSAARS